MANLSEKIQLIISNLEDGRDEGDWDIIKTCIEELEIVYDELDRQESGFDYEYE